MQANIRRGEMLISKVYKAATPAEKLRYALQALELITCEEGLAKRNLSNLNMDSLRGEDNDEERTQ